MKGEKPVPDKWWMGDKPNPKKKMSNKVYKTSSVDKKVKKAKKSNDIKDLIDPNTVDEVIGTIVGDSGSKQDQRRDKFILYWLLGFSIKSAGITAGYKYPSNLYKLLKKPIVRERILEITSAMPEKYRALCRMKLGDVAEVEGNVVQLMKDNPEMAMKHPQVLKQLKQTAGVLEDEVATPPTMNIKTLKIMQNINLLDCERHLEFLEEDPEDISQQSFEMWLKKKGIAGPEVVDVEVEVIPEDETKEVVDE